MRPSSKMVGDIRTSARFSSRGLLFFGLCLCGLSTFELQGQNLSNQQVLSNVHIIDDSDRRLMAVVSLKAGTKIDLVEAEAVKFCKIRGVNDEQFCNLIFVRAGYKFDTKAYSASESKGRYLRSLRESGTALGYFKRFRQNVELRMLCKQFPLAKETDTRICWESGRVAPWYRKLGESR